jgi:hypothetical protein
VDDFSHRMRGLKSSRSALDGSCVDLEAARYPGAPGQPCDESWWLRRSGELCAQSCAAAPTVTAAVRWTIQSETRSSTASTSATHLKLSQSSIPVSDGRCRLSRAVSLAATSLLLSEPSIRERVAPVGMGGLVACVEADQRAAFCAGRRLSDAGVAMAAAVGGVKGMLVVEDRGA